MESLTPLLEGLAPALVLFMTVVSRLSFVIFFMPGIGDQVVSVRTRLLLLLALSAAISFSGVVPSPEARDIGALLSLLVSEIIIGFGLGALLRLSSWMLTIVGTVIAQSIGLSQFLGVALEQEAQTVTSNLLSVAGVAILFTADFHVEAIAAMMRLYTQIPLGQLMLVSWPMIFDSFFAALSFAFVLSWPFVVANLLYNIILGFINKAIPSLMVAMVGAPFMVGAGIVLMALTLGVLLNVWKDRALQVIGWL